MPSPPGHPGWVYGSKTTDHRNSGVPEMPEPPLRWPHHAACLAPFPAKQPGISCSSTNCLHCFFLHFSPLFRHHMDVQKARTFCVFPTHAPPKTEAVKAFLHPEFIQKKTLPKKLGMLVTCCSLWSILGF